MSEVQLRDGPWTAQATVSGKRVLPVLYSDNYLTLLPHEPRLVEIRCPAGGRCSHIRLRGWNVEPATISIAAGS